MYIKSYIFADIVTGPNQNQLYFPELIWLSTFLHFLKSHNLTESYWCRLHTDLLIDKWLWGDVLHAITSSRLLGDQRPKVSTTRGEMHYHTVYVYLFI